MDMFTWKKMSCAILMLGAAVTALEAQSLTTLAVFNGANGALPNTLVQGADGNFYGTTTFGGAENGGIFFKITPTGTLTTLYNFYYQNLSPCSLMQGSDGNFYGTGVAPSGSPALGTIFKITSSGAFTTVYRFGATAGSPYGTLIQGADGNFYGTTDNLYGPPDFGFSVGGDTVYKMTPDGTVTILYTFPLDDIPNPDGTYDYYAPNGAEPVGLIQGKDGNFYGTTNSGGTGNCQPLGDYGLIGCGTVFKMTPAGILTTLYSFTGKLDGSSPQAPLVQGTNGNFYGTTSPGAQTDYGTVFSITPAGVLTTVHTFNSTEGYDYSSSPLIPAPSGSFYGITTETIVQIAPAGALTTLYNFCSQATCSGTFAPDAMILATDGNLYGTTLYGVNEPLASGGSVFKFSPPPPIVTPPANTPAIAASNGVVNGASFQPGIANGAWITITGTNLSTNTDNWNAAIVNGALPTTLDGVKVTVGGEPAYIAYISPNQINAVAPTVSTGIMPVTVTNSNGTSPVAMATVQAAQPAFFQWGTYAVATTLNYTYAVKNGTLAGAATTPAHPGDAIVLWGTGFGPTTPPAPVGFEVPATATFNTANSVTVTVGGMPAKVYGAALAPGYAGLYQVAIQIPALANGDYPLVATVSGSQSPAATLITVQQ